MHFWNALGQTAAKKRRGNETSRLSWAKASLFLSSLGYYEHSKGSFLAENIRGTFWSSSFDVA
jgi:hypothetical protein